MGRGFAVVADKALTLAKRITSAAQESAKDIESSLASIKKGNLIAERSVMALNNLVAPVALITESVATINDTSQSQAKGINDVNQGMASNDSVVHTTVAAEQTSVSATDLSDLSEQLQLGKIRGY